MSHELYSRKVEETEARIKQKEQERQALIEAEAMALLRLGLDQSALPEERVRQIEAEITRNATARKPEIARLSEELDTLETRLFAYQALRDDSN